MAVVLHCITLSTEGVSVFPVFTRVEALLLMLSCLYLLREAQKHIYCSEKWLLLLCEYLVICQYGCFDGPKTSQSLWRIREKFQRQDHIPVPAQCQHLLTDAAPFFLKGLC